MIRPSTPRLALLPIRFFFGITFLWAGFDKLLDPTFLDPTAATSLHAQLAGFARISPLGGLIQASLPYTFGIGVAIAIAEIGAGIGAITGLAFRLAAVGGMALSLLFWLTASWSVRPYYLGPDLPYAFGWLALAIAGHGGVLVPRRIGGSARDELARPEEAASPGRRLALQAIALTAVAAVAASVTVPLRLLGVLVEHSGGGQPGAGPTGPPSSTGTSIPPSIGAPSIAPSSAPTIPPGAVRVARVADLSQTGSVAFQIPFDAPAPLPAGDPAVIVELADGSFVAFDTVCTHAGCTVEWDAADRILVCPCHDAMFDPENDAAVLDGPAPSPLTSLPLVIDAASGSIFLVSGAS